MNKDKRLEAFGRLLDVMDELRVKCPWDRVQTFESLRSSTIEETYELVDALLDHDMKNVKKELGDLLLHVIFYSKIASEEGAFDIADVADTECDKLIFRHPHVFGAVHADTPDEVKQNWEDLKLKEKEKEHEKKRVLSGVPRTLPSLVKAYRISQKAASAGFDWETKEDIWKAIEAIGEMRGTLPYDIDGAVIKVNELARRAQLKDTAKNAGYQVAYKYPPERKETKLLQIELSVGRTGKITPTAIFEPVRLCGTTVSRCTLHNQDFITNLDIRNGSTLLIEKSGEVIPKCVGVVPEKQPAGEPVFQIPMVCPVCGSPAVRVEDTADIKCVNLNCPAQLERLIDHFVGRSAMDIKGFGAVYVHDLIEKGYLTDVADIFTLSQHREALIEQGIIGKEKNTDKLLAAIEKAKKNTPDRLLTGLGISNVGKSAAQALMNHFGTFDSLATASEEDMVAVNDIGPISAHCVYEYFRQTHNQQVVQKLKAAGVNMEQEIVTASKEGLPLSGQTVVITGTLPDMSREEAAQLIQANGGKVTGSVSKKTTFLLAGENAGSKQTKAETLGIPILTLEELQTKLSQETDE